MPETVYAYAKINLHLEVITRRDDGYHNILSLMASVDIYDLLKLRSARFSDNPGDGVSVEIVSAGGTGASIMDEIPPEENLITKAVKLYCGRAGKSGHFSFEIEKNIPAGAGLGGGSSDAAAALKLINDKAGFFGNSDLMNIGARIGADVPFCLTGGTALCEGTGEIVSPVNRGITGTVVIANPGIHVDTGSAYRALNRKTSIREGPDYAIKKRKIISACERGDIEEVRSLYRNDFEKTVMVWHPEIKELKESMYRDGAVFSTMSGSGSSVAGIFTDDVTAEKARGNILVQGDAVLGHFI